MLRHGLLITALALSPLALDPSPASASSGLEFARIQFDPPGSDTPISNDKLNAEYVTIVNTERTAMSLRDRYLSDETGRRYTFGALTLRPGAQVRVHTGKGTNSTTDLYIGSGRYIWNNDGDTARLQDPRGWLADLCSWTRAGTGIKQC